MNKLTVAFITLFMILSFTTMASAAGPFTSTGTGIAITFTSSGAGPALEFTPSPSTLISGITTATTFTAVAASSKTTTENGIEYAVISTENAMYQKVQATTATVTPAAATLDSDFLDKAGNAPGS